MITVDKFNAVVAVLLLAILAISIRAISRDLALMVTSPITDKPSGAWLPVVNPEERDPGGFVPSLYRADFGDSECYVAIGTFSDSLSCIPKRVETSVENPIDNGAK